MSALGGGRTRMPESTGPSDRRVYLFHHKRIEPKKGFEPLTCSLRMSRSTTELHGQKLR